MRRNSLTAESRGKFASRRIVLRWAISASLQAVATQTFNAGTGDGDDNGWTATAGLTASPHCIPRTTLAAGRAAAAFATEAPATGCR